MNITIIGTGNVGCTLAADLSNKGHCVSMLKTSTNSNNYNAIYKSGLISVDDRYQEEYVANIAHIYDNQYEKALVFADVIIVTVQTNYHEEVIKKMVPFLHDGQVVIFEPGYLSTCYLLKHCDKKVISIEAESSPIDCRIISPGKSKVLFKNVLNPFGVYPISCKREADSVLKELGYPFRFTENVIEAALHNPNLIVHTVGAFFSIPRIEYTKGEYWMYKEVFTPRVWNVCESLDEEKMKVLDKLGIGKRQKYVEACQERNFINDERSPLESFFDYANNSSPKGPTTADSRYITEDVSQGLVLLESLGLYLNVPTPVTTCIITLASVALGRNFREMGRTLQRLGIDNLSKITLDFYNSKKF